MNMNRLAGVAAVAVLAFTGTLTAHAEPNTPGAYCETAGTKSETKNGVKLICSEYPGEQQPRWREAGGSTATPDKTPKPEAPKSEPSHDGGGLAKTGV